MPLSPCTVFHPSRPGDAANTEAVVITAAAAAAAAQADIINRGMSGYNSRWALQVLPQALTGLGCSSSSQDQQQQQQQRLRGTLSGWGAGGQPQGGGHCNVALLTIWFGANDNVDPSGAE
jgi:hypothetical protein